MSNSDWRRAKDLLGEALELEGDKRKRFVADLIARQATLGREVETLLAAHEAAEDEGFLGGPAAPSGVTKLDEPPDTGGSSAATVAFDPPTRADRTLVASDVPPAPESSSTNDATSPTPKIIADDYEVLDELGVGGMGVVYRSFQRSLRRQVALKIIPTRLLRSSEQVARFYLEAEAAARLDHPGIVPVQDVGEHNGIHYYAMALVEGGSLARYVGKGESLSPRRAAEVIEQVSRAVQYAHDRAVIHRDIKPANILLDSEGNSRLTDFGLAKVTDADEGLTVTGQVMGTPSYMAPEQAEGRNEAISNRTDVYSLGATLYALLAGRPPFVAETVFGTLRKVQEESPQPLTADAPLDLRTICEKCLAKRPAERYESAGALADDLRRYLEGYPIAARPVSPWRRVVRWSRRNPVVAALLAAVATTLIAATVVSTLFAIEAQRQADSAAAALALSEQNARRLSQAIEKTFIFASEDLLAEEPGMQAARQTLLENAQRYYQGLMETGHGSAEKLAGAAFMLGRVQASLGRVGEARDSFDQALELQQKVVASNPGAAAPLTAIAKTHNEYARLGKTLWEGRQIDRPAEQAREGLEVWLAHVEQCAAWRETAAENRPADVELTRLYANALTHRTLPLMEQAWATGDLAAAEPVEELLNRAQALRAVLLTRDPPPELVERDYAVGLATKSDLRALEGDLASEPEQAAGKWRESLTLREEAAKRFLGLPSGARSRDTEWKLATCHQSCGELRFRLGQLEGAIDDFESMLVVMQRLLLRNPGVGRFRTGVAKAQFNLAQLTCAKGDGDAGAKIFADCQDTLIEGVELQPGGDSLPLLIEFTTSIASSLAEPRPMPQEEQNVRQELALGLIRRAVQLLEEAPVQEDHREEIEKALARLETKATEIRRLATPDRAT